MLRILGTAGVLAAWAAPEIAQSKNGVPHVQESLIVTVGPADADILGRSNREIQAAVDRVAALGGGEVRILPGVYTMEDSLHLRSRVKVVGAGEETILRKPASVSSPVSTYLGYGHYDVAVMEPDKFRVGMGVHIHDDRSGGFYDTVATLIWRDGDTFGISRMLNHDYSPAANGAVTSVFPVVSGCHIRDAVLEAITIDGNKAENARLNGCRGGGVFLLQAHNVALRGLRVRDYNGDGISFQQCRNTVVEDCVVTGMTGHGLHPGSGSVKSILRRNVSRTNGGDGIFYCLRVTFSVCEANTIEQNAGCGISIGGRDTDNLVRNNRIRENGGYGIHFRDYDRATAGHRNLIKGNLIESNCREQGDAEIAIDGVTRDVHITGNTLHPNSVKKRRIHAIRVGSRAGPVVVWDNAFEGGPDGAMDNRAGADALRVAPPATPLEVGPDAAPAAAARHLAPKGPGA